MDLQLSDKKVLITGASKGIGHATALAFAREGAIPVLVSRDQGQLEQAASDVHKQTGITASIHVADLAVEAAREQLHEALPDIDILVNNAGAIPGGTLRDLSMEQIRSGWELKLFGYIHLCKLYSATMFDRRSGTILNIIGMGGRSVSAKYISGAAANAALIGFTEALGSESVQYDVRVVGINPSPTATDRMVGLAKTRAASELGDESRWEEVLDAANLPFGRLKKPEEVASLAAMMCSPEVTYLSGMVVDMDGGQQWA